MSTTLARKIIKTRYLNLLFSMSMVRIIILNYKIQFIKSETPFEAFITQKNSDNGSNCCYGGK